MVLEQVILMLWLIQIEFSEHVGNGQRDAITLHAKLE